MNTVTPSVSSGRTRVEHLLAIVRRRTPIIALVIVLVGGVSLVANLRREEVYTASASLLFRDPGFDQKISGSTNISPSQDPAREAATNQLLVDLPTVANRAAQALGNGVTRQDVQESVTSSSSGLSNLIDVEATRNDPREAARFANAFATAYIVFRKEADRAKIEQALNLLRAQISELTGASATSQQARTLRSRQDQLELLSSLQTGNAELVQAATVPGQPSAPRVKRNVAFALVLGALLGLGAALIAERLDRRLRDLDEVEAVFGRPVLTSVPRSRNLERSQAGADDPRATEPFQLLRSNLRFFNVAAPAKVVMMTSPMSGDGKSTVSLGLAQAAARAGGRVLLVDCDLRKASLERRLVLTESGPGVAAILAGESDLRSAVVGVPASKASDDVHFDFLSGGGPVPNATELFESAAAERLIDEMRESYDLVVLDTPPITVVSDAIPIVGLSDGVVVVLRPGSTHRDTAARLRDQLASAETRVLGIVVNAVSSSSEYYYGADSYLGGGVGGAAPAESGGQ